jgi:hypothetical protein
MYHEIKRTLNKHFPGFDTTNASDELADMWVRSINEAEEMCKKEKKKEKKKGTGWYMVLMTTLVSLAAFSTYKFTESIHSVYIIFLVNILIVLAAIRYNQDS